MKFTGLRIEDLVEFLLRWLNWDGCGLSLILTTVGLLFYYPAVKLSGVKLAKGNAQNIMSRPENVTHC